MRAAGSPPLRGYPRPIRRPRPTLPGFPLSLSPSFQDTARAATKKKWFQVIRFPALPTTGMHGTELRVQERRTFRLSTPLKPFSPAPGSMLRDFAAAFYLLSSTEPEARNGLSLAYNGCRLSAASIPGSTVLACYFAPCLKPSLPVRPFCSITFAGSPRSMATSMRLARCSSTSRLD